MRIVVSCPNSIFGSYCSSRHVNQTFWVNTCFAKFSDPLMVFRFGPSVPPLWSYKQVAFWVRGQPGLHTGQPGLPSEVLTQKEKERQTDRLRLTWSVWTIIYCPFVTVLGNMFQIISVYAYFVLKNRLWERLQNVFPSGLVLWWFRLLSMQNIGGHGCSI